MLAGIACIFLSKGKDAEKSESGGGENVAMCVLSEELEGKIKNMCESVSGVKNVSVMLTLDTSEEYVYAKDSEQSDTYSKSQYVTVNSGDGTVELYVICPKVRGVAVVCSGGEKATVKQTLTELISSALGIPSSRVSVAGGK